MDCLERVRSDRKTLLIDNEQVTAILPVKEFSEGRYVFMATAMGTVKKTSLADFSRPRPSGIIAVDLSAAFRICRAALRPMLRRREGRIINISSVAGVTGNPGQANYSAAKAGLIGLTKALCREVGSRGITVNAVAPGFIATDMTAAMGAETLAAAGAAVPLRRLGTAGEVAAAVRFLALPEAAYITGHVLHVDGGLAA